MKTKLTIGVLCLSVVLAPAATRIWDGSSDGYWSNPANWSVGIVPTHGDDVFFPEGPSRTVTTNDLAALRLNSITMVHDVGYTLRGNGVTLTNGLVASAGSDTDGTFSVSLPIVCGASQAFLSDTNAQLFLRGSLNLGSFTLTCETTGEATNGFLMDIAGPISGAGGVTKTGSGQLILSGTNTFSGAMSVSAGDLRIASNTALGSTAGQTILNGGGLGLSGGLDVTGETLVVNPEGGLYGSLQIEDTAESSWSGPIVLNTNLTISSVSTLLTLSGQISGSGGLNVYGAVRMSGASANTYSGITQVRRGTLELQKTDGDAIVGPLIIGEFALGQLPAKVVRLLTGTVMGNIPVTIHGSSLLDLNGYSDSVASLNLQGGGVDTGAGTLFLAGDLTTGIGGSVLDAYRNRITGNLDLGGATRTFNIGAQTEIAADIHNGSIIKEGEGTLTLSGGASTYAGTTTINDGILVAFGAAPLGSTAGGTLVNDGGTLGIKSDSNEPLTLNGSGFGGTNGALQGLSHLDLGAFRVDGTIQLASPATIHTENQGLRIGGTISGTGPLTKTGGNFLSLGGSSDNNFSGDTIVLEGALYLSKNSGVVSVPGNLIIGSGVPFGPTASAVHDNEFPTSHTIAGSVTVNDGSVYDTDGADEYFDSILIGGSTPLRLNDGGDMSTGGGLISLPPGGQVVADPGINGTSTISGRLGLRGGPAFGGTHTFVVHPTTAFLGTPPLTVSANLEAVTGTANVIKSGFGEMRLTGTNSFTGAVSVSQGRLTLASATALGASGNGVGVNNGASLALDGSFFISGEPLMLNSTSTVPFIVLSGVSVWDDIVTLSQDTQVDTKSGSSLRTLNAIHGAGALTKTGPGVLCLAGGTANTFTNVTHHKEGLLILSNAAVNATILGPLIVGDGVGGANADIVRLGRTRQIGNASPVTITASGRLELDGYSESFGALTGSGFIDLGGGNLEINYPDATSTFEGTITGDGDLYSRGSSASVVTLTGNNTYTGTTVVYDGTLRVNGFQPLSVVAVSNASTLGGSGTVGHLVVASGGTVSPGSSAGVLSCSNALFHNGSIFKAELNGAAAGAGHDQLNVRGFVVLSNATLDVTLGFAPTAGVPLTIINNDGADAVTGTFAGLANGSYLSIGGLSFQIRYNGGTGNDVTLTYTNSVTSAAQFLTGGNGDTNLAPDECNVLNIVLTNRAGLAASNLTAKLVSETPGVVVTQPFSTYATLPSGVRATNVTPFQVSTTPQHLCGSPVSLRLEMQSSNQGSFAVPVVLASPLVAGSPMRFDHSIATTIPNPGMIQQNLAVSNFSSTIARVEVSFFIAHTADDNLDIFLISPNGTRVELTSDNGGTSDNYGTGCADLSRTHFSDLGSFFIDAFTPQPPYVGTYRPEQSLAAFTGLTGADVNGNWKLEVTDDSSGMQGSGTLNCVSLFLYPADCPAGSGQCELCPDSTLTSALGAGNLSITNRLATNGLSSSCVAPTACPGVAAAAPGARYYTTHVFQNGPSAACITAALTAGAASLQYTIYTNSFDPLNLCTNYLGGAGSPTSPTAPTQSCAVNLAANQTFIVVVNAFNPGETGEYTLSVTGGDCRPPLRVAHGGGVVVVEWSTATPGYQLERTNALPAGLTAWPPVTNAPVIQNGRHRVTDTAGSSNTFYRLRRP